MKPNYFISITVLTLAAACSKPADHPHHHDHGTSDNPNQALYNQVMDLHDEVMPRMEDLYKIKKDLQEQLANAPALTPAEKDALEKRLAHVDSVAEAMMVWMRQFNPLPDSADQEKAREYLEVEMEKIKKVRDLMLEMLEKEKLE
jgi:regulator of replication initiation timing